MTDKVAPCTQERKRRMGENPIQIRSRNSLLKALISLMEEKPFDKISISDIAVRAELSRQTFYTNFDTKEEILEHFLREIFDQCSLKMKFDSSRLMEFLHYYFGFWETYAPFLRLLLENNLSYLFLRQSRAYYQKVIVRSRSIDTDGRIIPYIQSYAAGVTYELLITWIRNNRDLNLNEISEVAYGLLTGGFIRGDFKINNSTRGDRNG